MKFGRLVKILIATRLNVGYNGALIKILINYAKSFRLLYLKKYISTNKIVFDYKSISFNYLLIFSIALFR